MARIDLGPLVFGTLPMGPLQAGLSPVEGGALIAAALRAGVKAVDTAELYGTYGHIRYALEESGLKPLIITKSHAPTGKEARLHFERALREMGVERLDVANVHGARLLDPFTERDEVFAEILKMKDEGKVGAVGLSTHRVAVAKKAADVAELEVVHPLINRTGLGIIDGTADDMAAAMKLLGEAGKTVYAMKALAGGNLIGDALASIAYVRGLPGVHSVALGMLSLEEVTANTALFFKNEADPSDWERLSTRRRKLTVMDKFCTGCESCLPSCTNDALHMENGVAAVNADKCVLCGYCAPACPNFLLRII